MMQTHGSRLHAETKSVASRKPVSMVQNSNSAKRRRRPPVGANAGQDAKAAPNVDGGRNVDAAKSGQNSDSIPSRGGFWGMLLGGGVAMIILLVWVVTEMDRGPDISDPTFGAIPAEYKPGRAFAYLAALCELGPRPSGSSQMNKQQQSLKKF